jgi:hypothetical protein
VVAAFLIVQDINLFDPRIINLFDSILDDLEVDPERQPF